MNMPDTNRAERAEERVRVLEEALRSIIEHWDGADDCTAAVARARALLEAKP